MTNDSERCTKCNQILKEKAFDKCMYCGEPIPKETRLDPSEKAARLQKKQDAFEKSAAEYRAKEKAKGKNKKKKKNKGTSVDDFMNDLDNDFGSDGSSGYDSFDSGGSCD